MTACNLFLIILILLAATACHRLPNDIATTIRNSDNKMELQNAVKYFSKQGNPEKLEALYFLIRNMEGKHSFDSSTLVPFEGVFGFLDTLYHFSGVDIPVIRSKWPTFFNKDNKVYSPNGKSDLNYLTADFLICNIEESYLAWEQTRARYGIDFSLFCEFVLPYAVYSEPREFWHSFVRSKLPLPQKLYKPSIEATTKNLNLSLTWFKLDHTYFNDYPGGIALSNLYKSRFGMCIHFDELSAYYNRAAGIPVAIDFVPFFADRSGGHRWTSVLDSDNHTFAYNTCYIEPIKGQKLFDGKIAKVYRKTYSKQPSSLAIQNKGRETLPPMFADACIQDVTNQYPPCFDVPVTLNRRPDSTSYVYLCTFDNQAWQAIAWAHLSESDTVFFANVRPGIVFLPAYFVNNQLLPAGAPFELTEGGKVKPYRTNPAKKQTMELHRKYPLFPRITMFATYMIGGIFQGANQADFSDADNLFEVEECPHQGWNTINLQNKKRYRYVRYLAPAYSWGNIAEMAFYSANNSTPALTVGAIGGKGIDDKHGAEATLDENPETWYETEALHDTYVGIDFGSPQQIGKIQFIPRTDNNGIEPGDIYELVYWDDRWVSCGIQKAKESKLVYNEVPSGGLYLLHNLTNGKEERIFTYTDGKQTWW